MNAVTLKPIMSDEIPEAIPMEPAFARSVLFRLFIATDGAIASDASEVEFTGACSTADR